MTEHDPAFRDFAAFQFDRDGGSGEWPVERCFVTHFVRGAAKTARRSGDHDAREHLVGPEDVLPFAIGFRDDKKVWGADFALTFRAGQLQLCTKCDQCRRKARGIHEIRRAVVAEYGVVAILTFRHERFPVFIFGQQTVAIAEIPAARALAKIAANGAHGENLRTANALSRVRKSRELRSNGLVFEQFVHGNERADGHAFRVRMNAIQAFHILDIHDALRRDDVLFHQAD